MVLIVVKRGDTPQFIVDIPGSTPIELVIELVCEINNGYLKIGRLCAEIEELSKHGITLPPNMQGLTDDQIIDLKLVDSWGEKCIPSGGYIENKDDLGRRNGKAPNDKMKQILTRTIDEAKQLIRRDLVKEGKCMDKQTVRESLMLLSGCITIVYPMGLPPHDPIKQELDNEEDLTGTQAANEVITPEEGALWFSGKEMFRGKLLSDYAGHNEKTKIIVKLAKRGSGAPAREPVISEEDQRAMMAYYYRKQEDWKKLDQNDEDCYLDSAWAEPGQLKRQFHGLGDIKWGPR